MRADIDYESAYETWKGFSMSNPYYSMQNVYNQAQGATSPLAEYSEVTVNVFLMKGNHHWIKCVNEDEVTFEDVGDWETDGANGSAGGKGGNEFIKEGDKEPSQE